jgi:hypothetical protein
MPWMAYWTNSNYIWNGSQIKQLGLNLNAPGDRSADDNILWFEFPFVAGTPPGIPVKIDTLNFQKIRKEPISIKSEQTPWISSSALAGVKSIEVTLSLDSLVQETYYTVNLYFAELQDREPGERIFDVEIQDENVIEGLDIVAEAGKSDREVIKSFQGIKAGKTIRIDLIPKRGNTLISGIELIQEKFAKK